MHHKRTNCRLCKSKEIKLVLPLDPILLGEHYLDSPSSNDEMRFPIDIYQCRECNTVQTMDDIDPNFLWKDYTYFSGQTKAILKHFDEFAEKIIHKYSIDKKINVLDIGSNDGSLLKQFKKRGHRVQGFDPASTVANVARKEGIPTIVSLFDESSAKLNLGARKFDLITAFNVFAHSENMDSMIKAVKNHLTDDGLFCFEVQSLKAISNKKILGTIFHEHMIHYSVLSAKNFLESNDLKIIDFWENNIQNGSIIFICNKKSSFKYPQENSKILNEILEEKSLGLHDGNWALNFEKYIISNKAKLKKIFQDLKKENIKKIPAYGAARSGPTLAIQFGLDQKITKIFDDHLSKIGKYAPFNNLYVEKTSSLNAVENKYTVILAYIHFKSIIKKHIRYIEKGGSFIILWPEVSVVNKNNYLDILNL